MLPCSARARFAALFCKATVRAQIGGPFDREALPKTRLCARRRNAGVRSRISKQTRLLTTYTTPCEMDTSRMTGSDTSAKSSNGSIAKEHASELTAVLKASCKVNCCSSMPFTNILNKTCPSGEELRRGGTAKKVPT